MLWPSDLVDVFVRELVTLYARNRLSAILAGLASVLVLASIVLTALILTSPEKSGGNRSPESVSVDLEAASQKLRDVDTTLRQGEDSVSELRKQVDDLQKQSSDLETFLEENPEERALLERLGSNGGESGRPLWQDLLILAAGCVGSAILGVVFDRTWKAVRSKPT